MTSFLTSVIGAPSSEAVLLERADRLAGCSLGSLTNLLGQDALRNLRYDKGGPGRLIECALGANANSRPVPDFTAIGVELKTIPLSPQCRPLEATCICTAPMDGTETLYFENSHLWRKLCRILWVPIIKTKDETKVAQQIIGTAFLWSPNEDQYKILLADWEELSELIACGQGDRITANYGSALQLRLKTTPATECVFRITSDGDRSAIPPRAFYLRASFTASIMRAAYAIP